jgi:hypothetical protein
MQAPAHSQQLLLYQAVYRGFRSLNLHVIYGAFCTIFSDVTLSRNRDYLAVAVPQPPTNFTTAVLKDVESRDSRSPPPISPQADVRKLTRVQRRKLG